ncbi:hypothetical protein LTR95_016533 [Oleoguttula sp. CCFEE 5521]
MPRSFRRQNANILITLTLFLLAVLYIKHKDTLNLFCRKALHYPTSIIPHYRAPLVACAAGDRVPESYYMFLHPGASLEAHRANIYDAVGLELNVTSFSSGNLYYNANNVNDAALEAIRRDFLVDMVVECDRLMQANWGETFEMVEMSEAEIEKNAEMYEEAARRRETMIPPPIQIFLTISIAATSQSSKMYLLWRKARQHPTHLDTPYQAPLSLCDSPNVNEGKYWVYLEHGYPLETHKQKMQTKVNLEARVGHEFRETDLHGLYYRADELDAVALEAVRGDAGVRLVECDTRLIGGEDDMVLEALWDSDASTWEEVRQTGLPTIAQ